MQQVATLAKLGWQMGELDNYLIQIEPMSKRGSIAPKYFCGLIPLFCAFVLFRAWAKHGARQVDG